MASRVHSTFFITTIWMRRGHCFRWWPWWYSVLFSGCVRIWFFLSFVFIFLWSIWAKTLEINFIIQTMTKPSAKKGIIWRSIWLDFIIYFSFVFCASFGRIPCNRKLYRVLLVFLSLLMRKRKWKSCKIVCHFDEISTLKYHKSMRDLLLFTIFSVFSKQHTVLLFLCLRFFLSMIAYRVPLNLLDKCKQRTNRTEILQRAIRRDFIK